MTYEENIYNQMKSDFMNKHKGALKIYTKPLEYNRYYKDYCFQDGATWSEISWLVEEVVEVMIRNIKTRVSVKLWKVEYFSTDDSKSRYYYEKA